MAIESVQAIVNGVTTNITGTTQNQNCFHVCSLRTNLFHQDYLFSSCTTKSIPASDLLNS